MKFLNSRILFFLIIIATMFFNVFITISLAKIESDSSVVVQYMLAITTLISSGITIILYYGLNRFFLSLFGLKDFKHKYLISNAILSTLLLNLFYSYAINTIFENPSKLIILFNPVFLISLLVLFYILVDLENKRKNRVVFFLIGLLLLNFSSQIISIYLLNPMGGGDRWIKFLDIPLYIFLIK